MSLSVGIEQPANHALILSVILCSLGLEELDTPFAQSNGYLDTFLAKRKFVWGR
jgi:hypothetical protein